MHQLIRRRHSKSYETPYIFTLLFPRVRTDDLDGISNSEKSFRDPMNENGPSVYLGYRHQGMAPASISPHSEGMRRRVLRTGVRAEKRNGHEQPVAFIVRQDISTSLSLLRLRCDVGFGTQHPHATCCNPRTYDYGKIFASNVLSRALTFRESRAASSRT